MSIDTAFPDDAVVTTEHRELLARHGITVAETSATFRSVAAGDASSDFPAHNAGLIVALTTATGSSSLSFCDDETRIASPTVTWQPETSLVIPTQQANRDDYASVLIVDRDVIEMVSLAASAPADVLVVGLIDDRIDLDRVDLTGRVVFVHVTDRKQSAVAYDRAMEIKQAATVEGAKTVVFVDPSSPMSLRLGLTDEAERSSRFGALVKAFRTTTAGTRPKDATPKRTPPPDDMPQGLTADMGRAVITRSYWDDEEKKVITRIVHRFAGRIAAERHLESADPSAATAVAYDVEMAVPCDQGVWRETVRVPASKLSDIDSLLNVRHGADTGRPTSTAEAIEIANAIRACEPQNRVRVDMRETVGWDTVDSVGFLHVGGKLTSAGNDTSRLAYPAAAFQVMDWTKSIAAIADDQIRRDSMRSLIVEATDMLVDRTLWMAPVGFLGLTLSGVVPCAALFYTGEKSSGKTTCAQTFSATMSSSFGMGGKEMSKASDTANQVDGLMNSLEGGFLYTDDFTIPTDPREREAQMKVLDKAVRRAHGASSKGRMVRDQVTGNYSAGWSSDTHPGLVISAEQSPDQGTMQSLVDRALTLHITAASSFKPGTAKPFAALGSTGVLNRATVAFIQWMAGEIEMLDSDPAVAMQLWKADIDEKRGALEKDVRTQMPTSTPRGANLAAGLILGYGLIIRAGLAMEAITPAEAGALLPEARQLIAAALTRHTSEVMQSMPEEEELFEWLRTSAMPGGRFAIEQAQSNGFASHGVQTGRTPLIGVRYTHPVHGAVVAIIAKLPVESGRWPAGWTMDRYRAVMKRTAIAPSKADKSHVQQYNVSYPDGRRYWSYLVPESVFDGMSSDPEQLVIEAAEEASRSAYARLEF